MKKKWHGVVLIICMVICVAIGVIYCFRDGLWMEDLPNQVVAGTQSEDDSSTTPKSTAANNAAKADTDMTSAVDEDTSAVEKDIETDGDSQEQDSDVTEEETGYNGDIFEANGQPYCIKVNRQMNVVTIYTLDEEGFYTVPYKVMVCSVGLNDKTPTGTFKLPSDRYEWRELVGGVYGQYAVRIKNSIMFHSVPYYSPKKNQLESEEYNKLGEPASKGCVRLSVIDAKWIYDNCKKGTIVQIFDSDYIGPLGKPEAVKLDLEDERSCYDPTDETEENPWFHQGNTEVNPNYVQSSMSATEENQDTEAPKIVLKENAPELLTEDQAKDVVYLKSLIEVTDESEVAEINVSLPLWVSTKMAYRVVYTATDIYDNTATAYYSFKIAE